jgi:hypothetical protein
MGLVLLLVMTTSIAALVWSVGVIVGKATSASHGYGMSSDASIDATTVACIAMMVASCDG